jgi:chromosome segregation ATPase
MKTATVSFALLFLATVAQAQQPAADPALARMREGMKKLVQRISESDAARVAAEAAKAEADLKIADLEAKLKAAEKKGSELEVKNTKDKAASDKTIADLNAKVIERDQLITQYNEALGKWKEGFQQAKTIAEGKEAERAAAVGKATVLERRVAAAEAKNAEMHKAAMEVLSRYEKFGFGTALLAREPFTRNMKVKLQNLAQEHGDKIDAQRIEPSSADEIKKGAE